MAKDANKAGLKVDVQAGSGTFTISVRETDGTISASKDFALGRLPAEIQNMIAVKGAATILQQRVSDVKTGAADRLEGMAIVWERWLQGDYVAERQAGGYRQVLPIIEVLVKAKARKGQKVTTAQVQKFWASLDPDQKAKYHEKFAAEVKEEMDRRATAEEVDLEDLL